jgi:hypothetical protein
VSLSSCLGPASLLTPGRYFAKMKAQALFLVAFTALATADQHHDAKEKCGRLGPMTWDPARLALDVDIAKIRMCLDHPAGAGNYWGFGKYLPDWFPRNPLAPKLPESS